jgi:hypothetical protein
MKVTEEGEQGDSLGATIPLVEGRLFDVVPPPRHPFSPFVVNHILISSNALNDLLGLFLACLAEPREHLELDSIPDLLVIFRVLRAPDEHVHQQAVERLLHVIYTLVSRDSLIRFVL